MRLLFDCDGVVVDSETLTNSVLRDDLAQRGLNLRLDEVMGIFVGGTMMSIGEMAKTMGAKLPDDWLEQVYAKIYKHLDAHVELIPGIVPVLDRLDAAGIPYAMGSNGSVKKMHITLGRTGLLDRFEGKLYSGQDMPKPKPAPDVYLKAAEDAGMAPERCAVIEDSAAGARAAVAAGMDCYGFHRETDAYKLFPHSEALFDDMAQLPDLLKI